MVLTAVRQTGLALKFSRLSADRKVVFAAVRRTGAALQFAAGELSEDREVALVAVR